MSPAASYRRTWGWAALVASGVHAIAIGALFLRVSHSAERSPDLPAIAIELAPPTAAPAPVKDAATPRQVEAPAQKPRPPQPPQPKPLPWVPPQAQVPEQAEVVLPPKEEAPPERELAVPAPPAPTTTELAAPDLAPDDKTAALLANGAAAGQSTPIDLWDARVLARIELTKRYPRAAARDHQEDDVDVLLTVDREGNFIDATVRRSRGFALLDAAALDAVRRAAPFPKPPKELEGEPIRLSVIVRFFKKAK